MQNLIQIFQGTMSKTHPPVDVPHDSRGTPFELETFWDLI